MPQLSVRTPDPNPGATSRSMLVHLAGARLDAIGVSWRPIAAAHGLSLDGEPGDDRRILTRQKNAFLADAAKATGDPLFCWRLGGVDLKTMGLFGYSILNAPNVGEALDTLAALMPTVSEAVFFRTVVDGDTASLVHTSSDVWQNSVFALQFSLSLLRDLIGPHFAPLRLGLALTERESLPFLGRQVSAPVVADQPFTFVTFPARHLRALVAGADERLAETLRPYWQREVTASRNRPAIVRSRLEGAVIQSLHEGVPTMARLAAALHLDRTTLASEMAAVGGYRAVVDDVRRRLAQEMVQRTDLTMSLIADRLGYSEPGALNHAYRRWTGRAPSADRQTAAASSGGPSKALTQEPSPVS